jgi:hypothetical protein
MFGQRSLHPPAFELTISGGIERPHRLQASVVLPGSNWVDLLAFTNTASMTNFVDTMATNFSQRFLPPGLAITGRFVLRED